jgi:hypothetical protein
MLNEIRTSDALNIFSPRICLTDRFIFAAFQAFMMLDIDEISRSELLLREISDFVVDNFK